MLTTSGLFSQCPTGLYISAQNDIDNFVNIYLGYDEVYGNLTINGFDIFNLNGLSVLNKIKGNIVITNTNLTSLRGINQIDTIGQDLLIFQNAFLVSIEDFTDLRWVKDISLVSNTEVPNNFRVVGKGLLNKVDGFNKEVLNLYVGNIDNLDTIRGFNNLEYVGYEFRIFVNSQLKLIDGFNNLKEVDKIKPY